MMDIFLKLCCSKRDKNDFQQEQPKQEYSLNQMLDARRHKSEQQTFHATQQIAMEQEPQYPISVYRTEGAQSLNEEEIDPASRSVQGRLKKAIKKEQAPKYRRNIKLWDQQEDALLLHYHEEFNGDWKKIAAMIPGRNISQCSQRWRRMKPQPIKPKWTPEEDQQVISMVNQHNRNWGLIAKRMQGRSGKQIRERYLNKLDPSLKTCGWTEEEDQILLNLQQQIGTKWSKIAAALPGRSENMVKNRYYTYIKREKLGQVNPYQIVFTDRQNDVKIENKESDAESDINSEESSSSSQMNLERMSQVMESNKMEVVSNLFEEESQWKYF